MDEIKSFQLTLRRLTEADAPRIAALLNDFEISKWLTVVPFPYSEADALSFIASLDPEGWDGFGIHHDEHGLIGVVGISDSLGYWIGAGYHGRGYAHEAAEALAGAWFRNSSGNALPSGYFDGNAASARVLEKLGFKHTRDITVTSAAQGKEVLMHKVLMTRPRWEARYG